MSGHDRTIEFTTVSVTPKLRDELRERRDELDFKNYGTLIEAMCRQFDTDREEST